MIRLEKISKRFGKRMAVHPLDLEIPRGQIFGLLGHNGAGKSTTIGMLLGQIYPDSGRVLIGGNDVFLNRKRALARVGAIFETPGFYEYMSGAANLRLFSQYSDRFDPKRMKEVVNFVGLSRRIQDKVAVYSHGMRQRLALAQALLPNPELLVLDEPGDGLDPEGIHEMRDLILQLNRKWGLTILLSSHFLHEVQQLCSHLAVMREGRLLYSGQWQALECGMMRVRWRVDRQSEAEGGLLREGILEAVGPEGDGRLAPGRTISEMAEWLVRHGFRIEAVAPVERTLEDFYLETIRRESEPAQPDGEKVCC